jgi:hypothetical protein
VPLLAQLSSPRSITAPKDRVSYEGVGGRGSKRAVLGGKPVGVVVIYTWLCLGLLAGMGYNVKFESNKDYKKETKLKINHSKV